MHRNERYVFAKVFSSLPRLVARLRQEGDWSRPTTCWSCRSHQTTVEKVRIGNDLADLGLNARGLDATVLLCPDCLADFLAAKLAYASDHPRPATAAGRGV
jgi:hypothetical protein